MKKQKTKVVISVEDAIENLSIFEEMDINDPYRLGIVKNSKFVLEEEEKDYPNIRWMTSQNTKDVLDLLSACYESILHYFKQLYTSDETDWQSPKVKKGIEAIMDMVGVSADKMDHLMAHIDKKSLNQASTLPEYEDLRHFFLHEIKEMLQGEGEGKKAWEEQWPSNEDALLLDSEKTGLKDFETIQRDLEYELFYLKDNQNKPFFHPRLLRNIKLFVDFDPTFTVPLEEDPFIRMQIMNDADANSCAIQILQYCQPLMKKLYHARIRKKTSELIRAVHYGIMALMLSANPATLLSHTSGKSSQEYFADFLFFYRRALASSTYLKWMAYPPKEEEKEARLLLQMIHEIAYSFFNRKLGIQKEMSGFLHRLIRKGEEVRKKEKQGIYPKAKWGNAIFADNDAIQFLLSYFPNGPMLKLVDLIKKRSEAPGNMVFEPLRQSNHPYFLYTLTEREKVSVLHIPSPTCQSNLQKAKISAEFYAFLYSLADKKENLLMIQLQDKTSWTEFARASALENLSKQQDFSDSFSLITLPKDTDFYHQANDYLTTHQADQFMDLFIQQVAANEECGFYFPFDMTSFAKELFPLIHQYFFDSKQTLSRRDRWNFIEIAYLFFTLKAIKETDPNFVSFTCKDAIDVGAAESALFYLFMQLFESKNITDQTLEEVRLLLYTPAMRLRERGIQSARLGRMLAAFSLLEEKKEFKEVFSKLF